MSHDFPSHIAYPDDLDNSRVRTVARSSRDTREWGGPKVVIHTLTKTSVWFNGAPFSRSDEQVFEPGSVRYGFEYAFVLAALYGCPVVSGDHRNGKNQPHAGFEAWLAQHADREAWLALTAQSPTTEGAQK